MKKVYRSMLALGLIAGSAMSAQTAFADTLIGTSTLTINTLNTSNFQWNSEDIQIEVAVMDAGQTTSDDPDSANPIYYITETDGKGYLEYDIKFEYNPGDGGSAIFQQEYEGLKDGYYMFSSIILKRPEFQDQFTCPFNVETGFKFQNRAGTDPIGFAFASSTNPDGLNPDMKVLNAFLITKSTWSTDVKPTVNYPAIETLTGNYHFVATDYKQYEALPSGWKNLLPESFDFTIKATGVGNQVTFENFIMDGSSALGEYDQATGTLTYKVVYFRADFNSYLYIAPEDGGYTGMSASTANYLKFQVGEDGSITCPNFSLGTGTPTDFTVCVDYYDSAINALEPEDQTPQSFEGTYTFQGTKYIYTDGAVTSTEPYELTVKINAANQVTSIFGYELTAAELANGYNQGRGKNDVYTLTTGFNVGVMWDTSGENTESILLGTDSSVSRWQQNQPITLTKNADGTYSISPLTLWHRTWELVDPDEPEKGSKQVYTLLYKWMEGDEVEQVNFAGTYEMNGTYYYYKNGQLDETREGKFTLEINNQNQLMQLAGLHLDEFDVAQGRNEGQPNGNTLTWTTGLDTGFSWETNLILLGGESDTEWTAGDEVTFTKVANGYYTLTPFTIWQRSYDGSQLHYVLLQKWNATEDTSGVININADNNAETIYYDLQGRKVNNPSNGLYIVKKGNDVKKVIIR